LAVRVWKRPSRVLISEKSSAMLSEGYLEVVVGAGDKIIE